MSPNAKNAAQVLSLPQSGGSVRSISESFQPDLFTGTANHSIPLPVSQGRNDFGPRLTLEYSSGNGNGPLGLGWQVPISNITRKTQQGLPKYDEDDVFALSDADDLVPVFERISDPSSSDGIRWVPKRPIVRGEHTVRHYRPRNERAFSRIEYWERSDEDVHWRVTTRDNVTYLYGRTEGARIRDPEDASRVYQWLLEETFDAKGNHIRYEYAQEDPDQAASHDGEQTHSHTSQRYIRRIFYGNTPTGLAEDRHRGPVRADRHYLFEVLFDYGDLEEEPSSAYSLPPAGVERTTAAWPRRPDPFSSYRAGFEVRTLRRCRRILMIHHFAELASSGKLTSAAVVKSVDLDYRQAPHSSLSLLDTVVVRGYRWDQGDGNYISSSMPPLTFRYSESKPGGPTLEHAPVLFEEDRMAPGLADADTALVDLFGRGLPDIVHTGRSTLRFWKNLGRGQMAHPDTIREKIGINLSNNNISFVDMLGDGRPELLVSDTRDPRYYHVSIDADWDAPQPVNPFGPGPEDRNTRLLDLTGNGMTDILETKEPDLVWHECLGSSGFGAMQTVVGMHDPRLFPNVSFGSPAVRLADMTGDGLQDIVLVQDGEIVYWPNLGYGRFGGRIDMKDSPVFEPGRQPFAQKRLFLADADGSGFADLIYVAIDQVHVWHNQSGNGWGDRRKIADIPTTTDGQLAGIEFVDFYGRGTTALVRSTKSTQASGGSNYQVLDLCGGVKPHLLTKIDNGQGTTTIVRYKSSTECFLEDDQNGEPWVTQLPFPVQVVDKVEVLDQISRTKLVTQYRYHHGYYDGREREFRGFGRVDRLDTEHFELLSKPGLHEPERNFDNSEQAFHTPPVLTETWFHMGVYTPDGGENLTERFEPQFWQGDPVAFPTVAHQVDDNYGAHRALKGAVLREEVYALDGTDKESLPFTVKTNAYRVQELQSPGEDGMGAFLRTLKESYSFQYERNADDPRIEHQLVLRVDEFGNITDHASIAYPRRHAPPDLPEQQKLGIVYTKTDFVNQDSDFSFRYVGLPFQTRTFEILGLRQSNPSSPLTMGDFAPILADLARPPNSGEHLQFEQRVPEGQTDPVGRIIDWSRTYFRADDAAADVDGDAARLDLGKIQSLGLPYETYQAAMTDAHAQQVYGQRITEDMLREGGYVREEDVEGYWWIPQGRKGFAPELFYQANRIRDPFGSELEIHYDHYALLVEKTVDALGNETTVDENDYRVLRPARLVDANQNIREVLFDALGQVVATAVRGSDGRGDSVDGIIPDLDPATVRAWLDDPLGSKAPGGGLAEILGNATTRLVYDPQHYLNTGQPNAVLEIAREHHSFEEEDSSAPRQYKLTYADGLGRTIQTKVFAGFEDGESGQRQSRWISTGATIYNNKGNPVRSFEPFEASDHFFGLAVHGVSSTIFYDPLQRTVGKLLPNHSFEKVVFDAWRQETWDANDTVVLEPQSDKDLRGFFLHPDGTPRLPVDDYQPTWHGLRTDPENEAKAEEIWPNPETRTAEKDAAKKAAAHNNTPTIGHTDSLGRAFITVAHNGFKPDGTPDLYPTRVELDIEGNVLSITDPRGNRVFRHDYDMAGRRIEIDSVDAGRHLMLLDVAGIPLYVWDSASICTHTRFDALRRPVETRVLDENSERVVTQTTYGESVENPEEHNLRGQIFEIWDEAGVTRNTQYDFKGNLLTTERKLLKNYKGQADWSASPELEESVYSAQSVYDALNRVIETIDPGGNRQLLSYNRRGLLDQVHFQDDDNTSPAPYVADIRYNAKGQEEAIEYGNGVVTEYAYEKETFRISTVVSRKANGTKLQELHYTYDPSGNIISIRDNALDTVYHQNSRVDPVTRYNYDPLYRLVEARGREHEAMTPCHYQPGHKKQTEFLQIPSQPVSNGRALRNYTQVYRYDKAGNLEEIRHSSPTGDGWTRTQTYSDASNRLERSQAGCIPEGSFSVSYDPNGNISAMPHLPTMTWDHANRLIEAELNTVTSGAEDRVFYAYDATGQRVRKVIERGGRRAKERIYLGGYEIFREYGPADQLTLERTTVHVTAGKGRIALVERRTDVGALTEERIRYQLGNHSGSSLLELNERGKTILHEEYYPYGGTAYMLARNQAEVDHRRYRYSGKERDDETGLYYYGARYYAPWLGRWISPDPAGGVDGANLYRFVLGNPVRLHDPQGMQSSESDEDLRQEFDDWRQKNVELPDQEEPIGCSCSLDTELESYPQSRESLSSSEAGSTLAEYAELGANVISASGPIQYLEKSGAVERKLQEKLAKTEKSQKAVEKEIRQSERILSKRNRWSGPLRQNLKALNDNKQRLAKSATRMTKLVKASKPIVRTARLVGATARRVMPGVTLVGAGLTAFSQYQKSEAQTSVGRTVDALLAGIVYWTFSELSPALSAGDALMALTTDISATEWWLGKQSQFIAAAESKTSQAFAKFEASLKDFLSSPIESKLNVLGGAIVY